MPALVLDSAPAKATHVGLHGGRPLAALARRELRQVLAKEIEVLRGNLEGHDARARIDAAIAVGKQLYSLGRSDEALPLVRAALSQARRIGDPAIIHVALTACGILSTDAFDIVRGLEFHLQALALAADARDRIEQARVWNNIGLVFALAGNEGLAERAYSRALDTVASITEPLYTRYVACANRAQSLFHLGRHEAGLQMATQALMELTPEFAARDPSGVVLLRRNLVNLTVATRRLDEAAVHVSELAALAANAPSPRAFIAATTSRAVYELATGSHDIALTRLDQALAAARQTPQTLRDTLICVIRAEEAAGSAERAHARLQELSEHVYRSAIERALRHVELAELEHEADASEHSKRQVETRLVARFDRPDAPAGWDALQRLSVAACLRFDETGWHGMRVGAFVQALARKCGQPPLRALELGLAAEVHDIGMLSVPEGLAAKWSRHKGNAKSTFMGHTTAAADMLRGDHPRFLAAREMALYHHAHWDGSGHPQRVAGKHIPLGARMCAIVDTYDDLVCGLGGRKALSMRAALDKLDRNAGTRFDPDLVKRFSSIVREEAKGRGIKTGAPSGFGEFQALVAALQEDRGFL